MKVILSALTALSCAKAIIGSPIAGTRKPNTPLLADAKPEEILSLVSQGPISANSKFGRSLLTSSRQLGNNYNRYVYNNNYDSSWMVNYDIVFSHCYNESNLLVTYVTFYLCPSEYSCDSTTCAKKGAEYVVSMQDFVYYYMDLYDSDCQTQQQTCEYYCENQANNGYSYNDDYNNCANDCLSDAGASHCISSTVYFKRERGRALSGSGDKNKNGENKQQEKQQVLSNYNKMKYYNYCTQVQFYQVNQQEEQQQNAQKNEGNQNENRNEGERQGEQGKEGEQGKQGGGGRKLGNYYYNQQYYYMGPYCANGGKAIYFGLFTDQVCTTAAASGTYEENNYGNSMPFSEAIGYPLVSNIKKEAHLCLSCAGQQDTYYKTQAHQACSTLHAKVIAACETTLAKQVDGITPTTTGCERVEELHYIAQHSDVRETTLGDRIMKVLVFFGVFLLPAVILKTYSKFFCGSTRNVVLDTEETPYERNTVGTFA